MNRRRFRLFAVLPAGLLALAVPGAASAAPPAVPADTLTVGRIFIHPLDVFSQEEAARGWPYRAARALHFRTRESTIRKFLLFHEGDPLDPDLLAETERQLRSQNYLKRASVQALPGHDGVADVEVTTQDTWTTEPRLAVARSGGVNTFGASILERNLLGTGRKLKFSYDDDVDRIRRWFEFQDPHFVRPYVNAAAIHSFNSDGHEDYLSLSRPFPSAAAPWAAGAGYENTRLQDRIYVSGRLASLFGETHRMASGEVAAALTATPEEARRLAAGFRVIRDRFQPLSADLSPLVPPDRTFSYLTLRFESRRVRAAKVHYLNRDARYEDVDLGPRISLLGGVSPAFLGVPRTTGLVEVQALAGAGSVRGALLTCRLAWSRRLGRVTGNSLLQAELRGVHRFGGPFHQTLVSRVRLDAGWGLDPDQQFFADGDAGLRAYGLREYEGDKRVIVNLEDRLFLGRELLQLVAPGAAVFADLGTAAPPGQDLRWKELKADVGLGLRLALPRASVHDMIRLDLAFPLVADRFGRRDPLLSFSSLQAF